MAFSSRYLLFLQQEDRQNRYLAIFRPLDAASETETALYQATESYGTKPGDSLASQRFEAQLTRGFESTAAVDIHNIAGIIPGGTGGSIRIQQEFGNLDSWRTGYYFDGRRVSLLHGGWSEATGELAFDEYGEIFDGEVEGQPQVGLDFVDVELRAPEQRLDFPICERLHRGIPWTIYGDGTNDSVDCGTSAAFDFAALGFGAEALICLESAPAAPTPIQTKSSSVNKGWRLLVNADRTVSLVTYQTGPVSQTTTTVTPLEIGRPTMVSFLLLASGTCYAYLDGVFDASGTGHLAPSSAAAEHLYLLRNDAGTLFLNAFVAEVRLWSGTLPTAADVSDRAWRTLTAAERLLPGLVGYWPADEGSGTTLTDRSGTGANGTITGALFRRALEGAVSLEGERMREVWGGPWENLTAHLVEANPPIWQIHSDKVEAVNFGREGGAPRTVNSPFTSRAAFLDATTVAPTVDVLISAGGTFARMAVPPTKKVTFDVDGDKSDGTFRTAGPDLVRYWITTRGPYPFDDATEIDDAAFDAAAAADTTQHQLEYDGEMSLREACQKVLRSGGWSLWRSLDTKLMTIHRFAGVAAEIAAATNPPLLTDRHVVTGSLEVAKVRAPAWRVNVYCRTNPTLMSSTDLVSTLNAPAYDDLRRFLLGEFSNGKKSNGAIRRRRRQAREIFIDSTIATLADGRAAAERELALWSGNEQALSFLSTSTNLSLDVMDAVYFHYQDDAEDGARQSRLDTSDTAAFIVAAVGVDLSAGAVRYTFYREDS